jgi:hypothetical protein
MVEFVGPHYSLTVSSRFPFGCSLLCLWAATKPLVQVARCPPIHLSGRR